MVYIRSQLKTLKLKVKTGNPNRAHVPREWGLIPEAFGSHSTLGNSMN